MNKIYGGRSCSSVVFVQDEKETFGSKWRSDRRFNREGNSRTSSRNRASGLVKHLERQLKALLALDVLDCLIFRLRAMLCVVATGQKYVRKNRAEAYDFIVRAPEHAKRTVEIYQSAAKQAACSKFKSRRDNKIYEKSHDSENNSIFNSRTCSYSYIQLILKYPIKCIYFFIFKSR